MHSYLAFYFVHKVNCKFTLLYAQKLLLNIAIFGPELRETN